MTYGFFLLLFVVLPALGMLLLSKIRSTQQGDLKRLQWHWKGTAILAVLAFVWTTPWDNYIVSQGVWSYGVDRVFAVIGYVPLEEYAFFILMTLFNSALFASIFLNRMAERSTWRERQSKNRFLTCLVGGLLILLAAKLRVYESNTYLAAILLWFLPPLILQWFFDPKTLLRSLRILTPATLIPTLYFSLVDAFAIHDGIWTIHAATRTGWEVGLLPLEEAFFFFVTSLLLAQGLILWHSLRSK